MIFGNNIDDNGVLIRTSTDKPPYFAVGFKSEKSNGKFRFVWLYKVRAKPLTENYATKEGTTINRQTGEVEWTAIKRTHDHRRHGRNLPDERVHAQLHPVITITPLPHRHDAVRQLFIL